MRAQLLAEWPLQTGKERVSLPWVRLGDAHVQCGSGCCWFLLWGELHLQWRCVAIIPSISFWKGKIKPISGEDCLDRFPHGKEGQIHQAPILCSVPPLPAASLANGAQGWWASAFPRCYLDFIQFLTPNFGKDKASLLFLPGACCCWCLHVWRISSLIVVASFESCTN